MKYIFLLFLSLFSCFSCSRSCVLVKPVPVISKKVFTPTDLFRSVGQLTFTTQKGTMYATGFAVTNKSVLTAGHFCVGMLVNALEVDKEPVVSVRYIDDKDNIRAQNGFYPIRIDTVNDICLLTNKEFHYMTPLEIETNYTKNVHRGDKVYILGGPLRLFPNLKDGYVIVTKGSEVDNTFFGKIFTSVPCWPGNSGSPIVSESGKVVGLMDMILRDPEDPKSTLPTLLSIGPTSEELLPILRDAP